MPSLLQRCVVILGTMSAMPGCMTWNKAKTQASYETIAANPTYDTAEAEKHHRKALRILNACLVGNPGDYAVAEEHLQKALVADVMYGPAHNSLGILYMFQRNLYLAAWEFEYAARLMPERAEPIYNLGRLYEGADRFDLAIEHYEQALALSPHDAAVTASLASARLKNGESIEELRPLLEAVVLSDNRTEWAEWAHDQLGRNPITVASRISSSDSPAPPAPPVPQAAPRLTPSVIMPERNPPHSAPALEPADAEPKLNVPSEDEDSESPLPVRPPPPPEPGRASL